MLVPLWRREGSLSESLQVIGTPVLLKVLHRAPGRHKRPYNNLYEGSWRSTSGARSAPPWSARPRLDRTGAERGRGVRG